MEVIRSGHADIGERFGSDVGLAGAGPHRARRNPLLGLSVLLRRRSLDTKLASGADPDSAPALALRARQLTASPERAMLAASLESLIASAARPRPGLSSAIPVRREAVLEARPELLGLAGELAAGAPVNPRGVAMVRAMLTTGDSPLYSGDLSVGKAAAAAHAALIR
jgi:hypothetical protein